MSRALKYAGAKNLLVSFWSVSDASTATLMEKFYSNLLNQNKPNHSESLRAAKIALVNNNKYAAPFYWAPFVLIGF